jgi:hypothetical protein
MSELILRGFARYLFKNNRKVISHHSAVQMLRAVARSSPVSQDRPSAAIAAKTLRTIFKIFSSNSSERSRCYIEARIYFLRLRTM